MGRYGEKTDRGVTWASSATDGSSVSTPRASPCPCASPCSPAAAASRAPPPLPSTDTLISDACSNPTPPSSSTPGPGPGSLLEGGNGGRMLSCCGASATSALVSVHCPPWAQRTTRASVGRKRNPPGKVPVTVSREPAARL